MKQIKDPIHGYISVPDDYIKHIIDTRFFQRLRYIRQLTATYMVYPGANHTRFEHSLGVFHLATHAFEKLKTDDSFAQAEDIESIGNTVRAAALLHDIGHPPMSHIGELLLDRDDIVTAIRETGFDVVLDNIAGMGQDPLNNEDLHELLSCYIILTEFSEGLAEVDVEPEEVCCYVLGTTTSDEWQAEVASDLVSSKIDVDRLDYIKRDDLMTGAQVAHIDSDRMLDSYTTLDHSLVLSEKALSTIRNFLAGRLSLYMWVNQHHKAVFANELLRRTVEAYTDENDDSLLSVDQIHSECIGDNYIFEKLRAWSSRHPDSNSANLFSRFRQREFLESCWKHPLEFEERLGTEAADKFDERVTSNRRAVESELRTLVDDEVWVVVPKIPNYAPSDLRSIHLGHRDEKRSVRSLKLFENPEFYRDIPFVYTSGNSRDDVIDCIRHNV